MENIPTAVTDADLAEAITDERSVKYSPDGLRLLKAPEELLGNYAIKPGTKVICGEAFDACAVTDITIPDSVTSMGSGAFLCCSSLSSIKIPYGVAIIENRAFMWCLSLASILIPDSVTVIGSYAFRKCRSLKSINIPDSVTSIGKSAFWGCSSLNSIIIPDSVTSIGSGAFVGCYSLSGDTKAEIRRRFGQQPF